MSGLAPVARARRLLKLYQLRALVDLEIVTLRATKPARLPHRRPAVCGTDSGYYHHRRQKKETACDACKLAHTLATRARERHLSTDLATAKGIRPETWDNRSGAEGRYERTPDASTSTPTRGRASRGA